MLLYMDAADLKPHHRKLPLLPLDPDTSPQLELPGDKPSAGHVKLKHKRCFALLECAAANSQSELAWIHLAPILAHRQ